MNYTQQARESDNMSVVEASLILKLEKAATHLLSWHDLLLGQTMMKNRQLRGESDSIGSVVFLTGSQTVEGLF